MNLTVHAAMVCCSVLSAAPRQSTDIFDSAIGGASRLSEWSAVSFGFEKSAEGKQPAGFSSYRTGQGAQGSWVVRQSTDGTKNKVLAQISDDKTGFRFPVIVCDSISAKDVDVSVRFRPISGEKDRAAGIVWRFKDLDNYYIVRANALEDNVVLYKVEAGKRTDLPLVGEGKTYGKKASVPSGQWSTLRVTAKGSHYEVFLNGVRLYAVEDSTFSGAGKVGLWTKADSVTEFDDLRISPLHAGS